MAHTGQHFQLSGDNQQTALDLLANQTGLNKSIVKLAAQKGAVWITKYPSHELRSQFSAGRKPERIRRLKRVVKSNERLDFYYNPQVLDQQPPTPECLLDKQDYSIWLKPRGMFSQGSKWGDFSALYRWVECYFRSQNTPRQCWIVHRLDRATQGLMILAHTKLMARYFSQQFEQGLIQKHYQANIAGDFLQTIQSLPAGEFCVESKASKRLVHAKFLVDSKPAHSEIQVLYYCPEQDYSRLQIILHTGRKHQIRRHLSQLKTPILGDRLYGFHEHEKQQVASQHERQTLDLQLTACQLSWTCPLDTTKQTLNLEDSMIDLVKC